MWTIRYRIRDATSEKRTGGRRLFSESSPRAADSDKANGNTSTSHRPAGYRWIRFLIALFWIVTSFIVYQLNSPGFLRSLSSVIPIFGD